VHVFVSHVVILRRLDQCKNPTGTLLNEFWKSPGNLLGWICRHRVAVHRLRALSVVRKIRFHHRRWQRSRQLRLRSIHGISLMLWTRSLRSLRELPLALFIIIIITVTQLLTRHMSVIKNESQARKDSHVTTIWMTVYKSEFWGYV